MKKYLLLSLLLLRLGRDDCFANDDIVSSEFEMNVEDTIYCSTLNGYFRCDKSEQSFCVKGCGSSQDEADKSARRQLDSACSVKVKGCTSTRVSCY